MLIPKSKKVPLVVITIFSIWEHPDKPVKTVSIFPDNGATGYNDFVLRGCFLHPPECLSIHFFRKLVGIHAEAGSKHRRKYHYLGFQTLNPFAEHAQVRILILPFQVGL